MEFFIVNSFYTYLLIDPITRQPFYVGKGTGRRMYEHYRIRTRLTNQLLKNKILKICEQGKSIIYEKVLVNVDERSAFEKERELVEQYGRKIDGTGILCNLTLGGEGGSSYRTLEQRKRQSERMKGNRGSLPIICKPVSQYTLDGEHVADFSSAKVASENVPSANRSYITQVCKGKRKSAGGYLWTYKGEPVPTFTKQYYSGTNQFSLDGILLNTFRSLTEAQKLTGIELHNISECCRGKSKTAGGFVWKYYDPGEVTI